MINFSKLKIFEKTSHLLIKYLDESSENKIPYYAEYSIKNGTITESNNSIIISGYENNSYSPHELNRYSLDSIIELQKEYEIKESDIEIKSAWYGSVDCILAFGIYAQRNPKLIKLKIVNNYILEKINE